MKLSDLSDEALLARFAAVRAQENVLLADFLEMLIEIEDRRLHLKQAHSTLWHFCTRQHGMSTGMAQRRILAARTAREFPAILAALRSGSIHLSNLLIIEPLLTEENVDALLAEAGTKRKKDVEAIAARMAPRADVADRVRKERATQSHEATSHALLAAAATPDPVLGLNVPSSEPSLFALVTPSLGGMNAASAPAPTSFTTNVTTSATPMPSVTPSRLAPPADRGRMQQLSAERHKLQATISGEVREKLERASELLRRQTPSGALGFVLEQALDALLVKLERRIFATKKPRAAKRAAKRKTSNETSAEPSAEDVAVSELRTTDAAAEAPTKAVSASTREPSREKKKAVPRETRRNVFIRDERQCTFTSDTGQRCEARSMLEIDHRVSRAKGGTNELPNLRAYCRAHNRLHAEEVFGREHVEAKIAQRRKG